MHGIAPSYSAPLVQTGRDLPTVSLLICMRNEARYIRGCLESVFAQDYAQDHLEVWIIDGESDDGSRELALRLIDGRPNYHLLPNPKITQAAGWNLGIRACHGQIIGIASAHSALAPDYVSAAVETLNRTGVDLVGGPMRAQGEGYTAQAIALATSHPFGVGDARFHYADRQELVDTVYMGMGRREVFVDSGGFDEEMVRNQDDEFSYRLLERGGRILCNPAIASRYYGRTSLRRLWGQYFEYGYWKVRVMQKHPRQMRVRQLIPLALVLCLLGTLLVSMYNPWGGVGLALVGGIYLSANLFASLSLAARNGWRYLLLFPFIFAILHFGYGLGSLVGIFKFWRGWANLARSIA